MDHNNKKEGQSSIIQGNISTTGKGLGFVSNEGFPEDIIIMAGFLNTALHGDEVELLLHPARKGERQSGEVTKVLKRAKQTFVGVLDCNKDVCFLVADDRKMYTDIFIPKSEARNAKTGDKAQVEIVKWESASKNPQGKILKILGKKGDHNVEIESIVLEKGFDVSFPPGVEKDAEYINEHLRTATAEEIKKRRDFRDTFTFTIDPVDAKDFDDALSYKELPDGKYEIGIHIADVSHFVQEGTALDAEALRRACSVYLVDRTIPMLPEVLSNDLCSLKPDVDRMAFSAVFIMDKEGVVHERWFGKTIIHSIKRFTYESAQELLDAKSGDFFKELNTMNGIAKKMHAEKVKAGAIEFSQEEIKFTLDENNKPIGVYKKKLLDTNKLIEEYMLLANREVAKFVYDSMKKHGGKDTGAIYRIHDVPNEEKITNLAIFVKALGYDLPVKKGKISSKDINALLAKVEGKAEEGLIKTAAVRSMAKAIYSTQNIGHFGLAFSFYTHFTSPIRRYPDLVVHRVLQNHLTDKKFSDKDVARFKHVALQSSEREVAAAEAERASKKYKQVEYMLERIGNTYEGVITGVTEWGIYVEEIETKCEGMVKLRDMKDDFYELNEKTYSLIGQKTKKKYTLGDKVNFKVAAGDLDKKTLDYLIV
ncbi:MAG TPA: ribonuclease R [Candidatus Paceibacterota bacterium]